MLNYMNQFSFLRYTIIGALLVIATLNSYGYAQKPDSTQKAAPVVAAVKSGVTLRADKLYSKLKLDKAIKLYGKAMSMDADTVYLIQRIAEIYKLKNDYKTAEMWYAKVADNPKMSAESKFNYAEVLRANKNYSAAQKYYDAYLKANPKAQGVKDAMDGMRQIPELSKDNPAYRVEMLSINTSKSDYAPAFYKDGKIIFSSNRSNKKAVYNKWSINRFSRIYVATMDSTMATNKVSSKAKGKLATATAAYNKQNDELVFARSSFKKKGLVNQGGKNVPAMQLYSSVFNGSSASSQVPLAFNGPQFSTSTPAFSKDGKTLYFASDKPGGFGGSDIYMSTRDANGKWSEPKNLGNTINTAFDEKFPFMADNGVLYFASNSPAGLGGLDVYKSKNDGSNWSKSENLGAPINSSKDDYGLIMDPSNKGGYFTSNREGGMGEDDIYHFTFDESKLEYKVTVKLVDADSQTPIAEATLALDCKSMNPENTLSDANGEKTFTIKGGKSCSLDILKDGYKINSAAITPADKGKTITIALQPDVIKLKISIKEKDTQHPVRDAEITIVNGDGAEMNYVTNENGVLEATVPSAKYKLSSRDYASIKDQFTGEDADRNTTVLVREYLIPRGELVVNVPLTANCFSSAVTITDIKNGEVYDVKPNTNGELRMDLRLDNTYLIEHNGRKDTISTYDLKPGQEIPGPCKFYVGQTWIINNIYYDFNKWEIRKDAAQELDNVVRIMKENPTLEIELSSHTDCRGSAKSNMVLSAKRAKSAVDYLSNKGIRKKRIIAAGYGELKPVNNCICEGDQKSDCTEEQHQQNRRTEVKVLKY